MKSKRAGKTGARKYYNGQTNGPGGVKCPCCGAILNAARRIRRKEKQRLKGYAGPKGTGRPAIETRGPGVLDVF